MQSLKDTVAVVTGASSGFGEAIARTLADHGANLSIGARRLDRIEKVADEIQRTSKVEVWAQELDVRNTEHVEQFVEATLREFGQIDILVNNAGLALGKRDVSTAEEKDWVQMMETNFLGAYRMTKAVLPTMQERGKGHIVNVGSVAGHYPYEGGAGYCGSKYAVRAFSEVLRLETVEKGIKVSSVDPGLAETEFSLVRFSGDRTAAKKVYEGMTPLSAQDVADTVLFVVTRPSHVNIDEVMLTPLDQGTVFKVHRRT
jgi:3-hydroxy acid dehydrogenase / malonic semialdehyde reductase